MPYCEAIVTESIRVFMSFTFGIAHRALRDTKLSGYDIPRDTMVVANFEGLLNDSRFIKNPRSFDPENFLDADGKLSLPDKYLPFGIGKHRCIGDVLAKGNLFLLCTTLVQNFYFNVPDGHPLPSDIPLEGATPSVSDYEAIIIPRN